MKLLDLPIDCLEIPPVRITMHMPEDQAADFAADVAAEGVREALDITLELGPAPDPGFSEDYLTGYPHPIPGAHYWVVNGKHRIQEGKARGDLTLPCNVTLGSLDDAIFRNLATSGLQGRAKTGELRRVIRYLEEEKGLDAIGIRQKVRLGQTTLERLMWCNRAIQQAQDALDDDLITVGHCEIIARFGNDEEQTRLLALQLDNRLSVDALRIIAKGAQEQMRLPPPEAPPPPIDIPRTATCHYCRSDLDPAFLTMAAVCPDCEAKAWSATRPVVAAKRARGRP